MTHENGLSEASAVADASGTAAPEGRSRKELLAIVAASHARLERIHDAWDSLTDDEQERLAVEAETLASENEADEVSA